MLQPTNIRYLIKKYGIKIKVNDDTDTIAYVSELFESHYKTSQLMHRATRLYTATKYLKLYSIDKIDLGDTITYKDTNYLVYLSKGLISKGNVVFYDVRLYENDFDHVFIVCIRDRENETSASIFKKANGFENFNIKARLNTNKPTDDLVHEKEEDDIKKEKIRISHIITAYYDDVKDYNIMPDLHVFIDPINNRAYDVKYKINYKELNKFVEYHCYEIQDNENYYVQDEDE